MDGPLLPNPGESQALVGAVRYFHSQKWCPATSSNFSLRAREPSGSNPAWFWISQSGVDKGALGPEHLMLVDERGVPVPPEARRPSAETGLHALVYRLRPNAGSVLHVHAPHAVVASRMAIENGVREVRLQGWELQKALHGNTSHETQVKIPVFANHQDMEVLAHQIEPILTAQPQLVCFLLAGHGLYSFGATVAEAKRHVEAVENLLQHAFLYSQYQGERK